MSIFREIPPTAGWPIYTKDLLSVFKRRPARPALEQSFKDFFQVKYAQITNSGTAALYLLLEALKDFSGKRTVVIPAYICPLVPLAIKRAGLKVEVCDINPDNFDFDIGQLEALCRENGDVLAIVAVHLGGICADLDALGKIARSHGIFLIEDCAQALGALYKGRFAGTKGDFSFFSLCRGKGLTIYEGGVLVSNREEYVKALDNKIRQEARSNIFAEGIKTLELLGYWIFYRPQLFWFVYRMPQIFWNLRGKKIRAAAEEFSLDFPVHAVSELRKAVGRESFYQLGERIKEQRERAHFYIEGLKGVKGVRVIGEPPDAKATYPYLALVFDAPAKRDKALSALQGLGASKIYALTIAGYDYLGDIIPNRNCANAGYLAERALALSTSRFLETRDLSYIINVLKNCV